MQTKVDLCFEMENKGYLLDEIDTLRTITNDYFSNIENAGVNGDDSVGKEWKYNSEKLWTIQSLIFEKLSEYRQWSKEQVKRSYAEARESENNDR